MSASGLGRVLVVVAVVGICFVLYRRASSGADALIDAAGEAVGSIKEGVEVIVDKTKAVAHSANVGLVDSAAALVQAIPVIGTALIPDERGSVVLISQECRDAMRHGSASDVLVACPLSVAAEELWERATK